jgi:vanillin dehydrogenase
MGLPKPGALLGLPGWSPRCRRSTRRSFSARVAPYGLTAGIITENTPLGLSMARRIRTGLIRVNDQPVDDEPQAPSGGVGDSGYGRFGGRAGIEAFTETRWLKVQNSHRHFPI